MINLLKWEVSILAVHMVIGSALIVALALLVEMTLLT